MLNHHHVNANLISFDRPSDNIYLVYDPTQRAFNMLPFVGVASICCVPVCVLVFFSNFFYNYVSIHSSICISAHINMEKKECMLSVLIQCLNVHETPIERDG